MGRFVANILEEREKEAESERARSLMALTRTERLLLLTLRLWALTRHGANRSHAMGEWRQVFLASLEPARTGPARVVIAEGAFEDALADFDGFLAALVGAPDHIWRFHHPRCIGIDTDEVALLNLLRLMQQGNVAAGTALLRGFIGASRAERALRYLGSVIRCLGKSGLGLPLANAGDGDRGLNLTH